MEKIDIKKDQHFWHFITSVVFIAVLAILIAILQAQNKLPTGISWFDFTMLSLATFRITRLLVHDLVSDFIRDYFEDATYGLKRSMRQLLHCPWCTGAWVALGVGFFYFLTPFAWPILLIFAIAGFGTLLTIFASLKTIELSGK